MADQLGPSEPEVFGLSPDDAGDEGPPFIAVSDGQGEIAGYAEADLINSDADLPSSPEEALERNDESGTIVRVFNEQAEVVGYFASGVGFVAFDDKSDLVNQGWRYIEGSTPDANG